MSKYGYTSIPIAMVRQLHNEMQIHVQNDGKYSELFPVINGVKRGCVMAPTLLSMMFSAMLTDAFKDCDACFPIRYRKLFNIRQFQGVDRCTK